MSGGRWSEAKKVELELRREKNHQKKEDYKKRDSLHKNFGVNDDLVEKKCSQCLTIMGDVYRFRVELPELRSRITGYPVMEICPRCYDMFDGQGARLVSLPNVGTEMLNPFWTIYDPAKPRRKLF